MILKLHKPDEVREFEGQGIGEALVQPNPNHCGAPSGSNYERQQCHHDSVAADSTKLGRKTNNQIRAKLQKNTLSHFLCLLSITFKYAIEVYEGLMRKKLFECNNHM